MRFLRQTKTHGLIFWRSEPWLDLPPGPINPRQLDDVESQFPHIKSLQEAYAFVDAAHARCLRIRHSTGANIVCLGGTTIAYKTKLQPTVATSSIEAEFIAAVQCAKSLKHI